MASAGIAQKMTDVKSSFSFNPKFFKRKKDSLESLGFSSRYIKPPRNVELTESYLKYSNAQELAKQIQLGKNERAFVLINGTFYFGDFIEALIVERNFHVKKMTISTLSLNQNNVDSLDNLLTGGYVDELNLIVSDYFYAHERQALIPYIYERLDKDNKFQLAAAGTHCKLCIFETHSGGFVVIHGSANLRTSSNIEQFVIEENEQLYRFNDDYQQMILDHYKTINKDKPVKGRQSIRGEQLWRLAAEGSKKQIDSVL